MANYGVELYIVGREGRESDHTNTDAMIAAFKRFLARLQQPKQEQATDEMVEVQRRVENVRRRLEWLEGDVNLTRHRGRDS